MSQPTFSLQFQPSGVAVTDLQINPGESFQIRLTYDPTASSVQVYFNQEDPVGIDVAAGFDVVSAYVTGDVFVNFIGFRLPSK